VSVSKIQWTALPRALRDHLFDDLYQLKLWRESDPEAPDGPWFKDFGSFKICGRRPAWSGDEERSFDYA